MLLENLEDTTTTPTGGEVKSPTSQKDIQYGLASPRRSVALRTIKYKRPIDSRRQPQKLFLISSSKNTSFGRV